MSSRSFRRRNNRRRHSKGGADSQRPAPGAGGAAGGERAPGPAGAPGQPVNPPRGHRRHPGGKRNPGEKSPEGSRRPSDLVPRPEPLVFPDCPICRQPVRELASALTHRQTGQPAHFDCIMRELRDANELAPQEKLCYLGGGTFGILEFRQPGTPGRFVIRKRIQYEEKETAQEWKKPLLISL